MSKNELRAKAAELAKKLGQGLPDDFSQMNADALEVLVAELEASVAALPPEPSADGKPPAGSDAKPAVEAASVAAGGARYFIAGRTSMSTTRGVRGPGEEVRPSDILGLNNEGTKSPAALLELQKAQLEYHVSRGTLVKR
jgi:hypothetical protein